jgi:cholesterol oxidase
VPSAIAGQSFYGLNSGAKRSLDHNYLAMAEATGHVEVLPLHNVMTIDRGGGGRYAVTTVRLSDEGQVIGAPRRLVCKHLFLAAGSIGTTSLLVRARETGALPALNEHVGRHWAANGDLPVTRGALPFTNAGTGGPAGHFILEDLANPFGPTSLVELVLPPHIATALAVSVRRHISPITRVWASRRPSGHSPTTPLPMQSTSTGRRPIRGWQTSWPPRSRRSRF